MHEEGMKNGWKERPVDQQTGVLLKCFGSFLGPSFVPGNVLVDSNFFSTTASS